jgi:DNA-binding response OmpR family regulator
MMPHMDGHGVLKSLKRLGLRESTKTLILTCKGQEVDWFDGYKSGAHQYLTKPFDPQELVDSVERLLGMSPQQLNAHRDAEYDRAQLLSRLEGLLG